MFDGSPDVLTVKQAAELLSVSKATIYGLIDSGELKSRHVGRLIRIRKTDLIEFVTCGV